MEDLYPFFLIIFAGVFFSLFFKRIHVPWVVGLILGGIFLGPHVLNILPVNSVTDFIGEMGLIFLMFMAGLETRITDVKDFSGGLLWLAFVNGAIPFAVGLGIGFLFGYGLLSSLLIGTIFVSSSIAVVIPTLEKQKLLHTKLGRSAVLTIILQDVASLILLSIVLQTVSPVTPLPLFIFYPLVILALFTIRFFLPRVEKFFISEVSDGDLFQQQFRTTFVMLLGTVLIFEVLGLHPVIAAFFAGAVLSDSIKNLELQEKIRTIGYGIFIPTFFIIIGAQTDIGVLQTIDSAAWLIVAIVIGSMVSKFGSGWLGARMVGFKNNQSLLFATASIPQLSTTLAVAFAALTLGFIDQALITAMVVLSVVTTFVSPVLMNSFSARLKRGARGRQPLT